MLSFAFQMKQKNLISFLLTGLFLLNLFTAHAVGFIGLVSGEKMSLVNPFCKKANPAHTNGHSDQIDYAVAHTIAIPAICTTVFDFKNPTFSIHFSEDNFKEYIFHDSLHSHLFSNRHYNPPQA